MSGAALRRVSRGYCKLPYSVAENMREFTRAELLFLIALLRRGAPNAPTKFRDKAWSNWTGLSQRALEYAAAGLRKKGLEIRGRGRDAEYIWHTSKWEDFVRHNRPNRARTEGRSTKAVSPRPGAKVHPACRDRGCALMAAENGLSCSAPTKGVPEVAQPVAQTSSTDRNAGAQGSGPVGASKLVTLPTPPAQPVAQSSADPAELLWPKTLAALQSLFPLVGTPFLIRLAAKVQEYHRNVTDTELCQAVGLAWDWKKKTQYSEGLFLMTVPNAVAAMRRLPKNEAGKITADDSARFREGARRLVESAAGGLAKHGQAFAAERRELLELLKGYDPESLGGLEAFETGLGKVEARIVKRSRSILDQVDVEAFADERVKEYARRFSDGEVPLTITEDIRSKARVQRSLELLGLVSRLSLFYA